MAQISHFQRYSQRENHVTNNTLLLLRHLYQADANKLQAVLNALIGDDKFDLGLSFQQQTREAHSVPDAVISQSDFRLYIETKLTPTFDIQQLQNHARGIAPLSPSGHGSTVLLGLATDDMPAKDVAAVTDHAASLGVIFRAVTFVELVAAVKEACADHETAIRGIINDYVDFLNAENLLFTGDDWMLVVPCGVSMKENATHGVYYDGAHRPRRSKCSYLGLYADKQVSLIGAIESVFVAAYRRGALEVIEVERGTVKEEAKQRVAAIIEATPYYDLRTEPHRFFVVDEFKPTSLIKGSKGSVRGARYLQLSNILGAHGRPGLGTAELADRLKRVVFS